MSCLSKKLFGFTKKVGQSEPPKFFPTISRYKKVILVFRIYNYSGLVKQNHKGLIILSSWCNSRVRNQQGDIMTEPKKPAVTLPKAKAPTAPKPKQTFVPKMTVMRKAGRGR